MPLRERVGWVAAFLAMTLALAWPAMIHGRPAYFFDSVGYYSNGESAVTWALKKLGVEPSAAVDVRYVRPGAAEQAAPGSVVAIRALAYSLVAYAAGYPGGVMNALVAVQAAVAAAVLMIWWRRIAPGGTWRAALGAGLLLGAFSAAPWFSSYAMPDVFAGIGLLGFLILAAPGERPLGAFSLTFVTLVIAFAFAAHASHVPLMAGLALCGIAGVTWNAWRERRGPGGLALARFAAPVAVGSLVVLAGSVAGFKEVSLTPKRLPLVLARSIADGPARWYLDEHCATEGYVICKFFPKMPGTVEGVLFGPNGLRARATPEEMDAIRREEGEIISRATRAYPLHQARQAAIGFLRQLVRFDLNDTRFGKQVARNAAGEAVLIPASENNIVHTIGNVGVYAGVFASFAALILMMRRPRKGEIALVLLLAAGLIGNAAITGILSGVAHRYQGRVMWVLPALVLGFLMARWAEKTRQAA